MTPLRTCSCGRQHFTVPANARRHVDADAPELSGYYAECQCLSTLLFPLDAPRGVARTGVLLAVLACAALAIGAAYLARSNTIFLGFGEQQAKEPQ